MNKRKISIIIPMYNCENFILKCLKSIISQKIANYEVILINDGSTDLTEKTVLNYIKENKLDNYIYKYKENSGASDSRNFGISLANGEWIVFVDADDFLDFNFFNNAYKIIDEKNIDWIIGNFSYSINGEIKGNRYFNIPQKNIKENVLINILNSSFSENRIESLRNIWGKLYKTDVIKKNKIKFNSKIKFFEDGIFNIEYLNKIENIKFIDTNCYFYNYNPKSITHTFYKNRIEEDVLKVELLEKVLKDVTPKVKIAKQLFYYEMFCSSITSTLFNKNNDLKLKEKIKILKNMIKNKTYMNLEDYNNFKYSKFSKKILYVCICLKMYYIIFFICYLNNERRK